MAKDYVAIGNQALSKLGYMDPIIALSDATKAAQLINQNYEQIRDVTLRMHPWNFAKKRATLAPLSSAPTWVDNTGDKYFQFPGDCLRPLRTDNVEDVFSVEGRSVLYNGNTLKLLYVYQVTDTTQFDTMFTEAYTTRLAMQICMGLTQSLDIMKGLEQLWEVNIRDARSVNSFEQGVITFSQNDLVDWRN